MADKDFGKIAPNRLHWYNGCDTSSTLRLWKWQKARLGPFTSTWRDLVNPAFWALGHVERWGALLSETNVRAYDAQLVERIEEAKSRLFSHKEVPKDFNVRSPDQKKALLFGKLGLKSVAKTKKGNASTGEDVLEELQFLHPDNAIIPAIRDLAKAEINRSSYGIEYLRHIGYDGRVHPLYGIIRSGRLSTKRPTIQNLTSPDDDDEVEDDGKLARGCYVAPEGYVFVSLDYSMQELRCAAMLSGDEELAADLNLQDFHANTARLVFNVPPTDKPTKLQRRSGKTCNFGIAFDQGSNGLARKLTELRTKDARENNLSAPAPVEESEAQGYIDRLLGKYKKFAAWRRREVAAGEASGDSWSRWGGWVFRRQVHEIGEIGDQKHTKRKVSHAKRVCINNPIQNQANNLCLMSLYRCVARIIDEGLPAELCMSIHDALNFYMRADVWQEIAAKMREEMLGYDTGCATLKVDIEVGPDFGHMKKVSI